MYKNMKKHLKTKIRRAGCKWTRAIIFMTEMHQDIGDALTLKLGCCHGRQAQTG
jgi:hypothetical protein